MTLPASATMEAGGRTLTAAEAAVASLRVAISDRGLHDDVELVTWRGSKLEDVRPGDPLAIALGAAGSETNVWSGLVDEVEGGHDGLTITGLAMTSPLSQAYRAQAYVQQGVADIVEDLAADVDIDQVSSDVRLEAYCVDTRGSVWDAILDLAAISGSRVSQSAAGGLRFVPSSAASGQHTMRFGADLLGWRLAARPERSPAVAAAHGAASGQGSSRWHWLVNDPAPSADGE